MTEFGNAERMLDHYGEGLMYVPELAGWYAWTGVHWRRIADEEMEHRAKETIRALPDEAKLIESDAERAEFFKFCAVSQRAVMTKNMVTLARSDPRVMTPVVELDRDLVSRSAAYLAGEIAAPGKRWGWQDPEVWREFLAFLEEEGLVERGLTAEELWTDDLVG